MIPFPHPKSSLTLFAALLLAATSTLAESRTLASIMEQLDRDLGEATSALMQDDLDALARAADAIAEHPAPSADERGRIVKHLGPDARDFRAHDQEVHKRATALGKAARNADRKAVLRNHGALVESCVACHTDFRDRVAEVTDGR